MEAKFAPYQRLVVFVLITMLMALLLSCKTTSLVDNEANSFSSHAKYERMDRVANDTKMSVSDITTDTRINRQVIVETFDSLGRLSGRITDNSVVDKSHNDKSQSHQHNNLFENAAKKEADNTQNVDRSKTTKSNEVDNGFSLMVIAVCVVLGLLILLAIGLLIRKYL